MARRKKAAKRTHRKSRRTKKAASVVVMANPRKRRKSRKHSSPTRRRHRRNPAGGGILPSAGFIQDALFVTGGFVANKIVGGMVLPMIGVSQPLARIAVKGGVAVGLGFLGRQFLGRSAGNLLMLGGLVDTLGDAIQTYVAPMVPALQVSAYPELSSYPTLAGPYDNPYGVPMAVGASEFDEAM